MILNKYVCLWFPGKQSFVILHHNEQVTITLSDLLKSTEYFDSVVPDPGLVCDDGNSLYLGLFTHKQMEEINYTPNGVPIHEGMGTMSIVQCTLSDAGKIDSKKNVGNCVLYQQTETMEYFKGLLLILANAESLDTIPVNPSEAKTPAAKN